MPHPSSSRTVLAAIALVLLSVGPIACIEAKSTVCASGIVCPVGSQCTADQDACIEDTCGDGIVQSNEACDDGNINSGDGCNATCESDERCGNGILDGTEECDEGKDGGNGCNTDCRKEACGNGTKDPSEKCDDGNTRSGDGCSADCSSTERCGNGIIDPGEVCEPELTASGKRCSSDCKSTEVCGNGIIDLAAEEVCDDGNSVGGDGCSADCQSDESCGNRILDPGEFCDDGNNVNGDGCSADCRSNGECRNGILDPGEECDDGDNSNNNECLNTCKLATCGDGYLRETGTTPEVCDDGNASACGSCNATCTQKQAPARARGTIMVDGGVQDGEILVIHDGFGRCIFEFDTDGKVLGTHAQVRPTVPDNELNVAYFLHSAISDATTRTTKQGCDTPDANSLAPPPALRLQIHPLDGGTRLELEHSHPGPQGNQPIIESVENSGFTVTSMRGGAGWDCPVGTGCTKPHDCDPLDGTVTCVIPDGGVQGRCGVRRSP